MRINRIFEDQTLDSEQTLALGERAAHHVVNVLRLRKGASLVVFNGVQDGEFEAVITRADRRKVEVKLGTRRVVERESALNIHLLQGLSRAERMDLAMQKAVELGVVSITPVTTERSVVKLDAARAERRLAHWRQIVIHACEQSGRTRIPTVHPCVPLPEALRARPPGCALVLSPRADIPLARAKFDGGPLHILIGPEGGLSEREGALAGTHDFQAVSLGPRVLRTETATLAALATAQATWGDFN